MGIDAVTCPTCGADARIGLPQHAEVLAVEPEGDPADEGPTEKTRTVSCSAGHEITVRFTIEE